MAGTISDWIIEFQKHGMKDMVKKYSTSKMEDYQRIRESGLPVFDDIVLPLTDFTLDNMKLRRFMNKYSSFVIRAVPNTKKFPRKYRVGTKSIKECIDFINEEIDPKKKSIYTVLLTEHEPTEWGSIVISRPENTLIEIGLGNQDELAHGQINPLGGTFDYQEHNKSFKRMSYTTENIGTRELMWQILSYLRKDKPADSEQFPNVSFIQGYFELVVTKKGKIQFIDYKINEMYLK